MSTLQLFKNFPTTKEDISVCYQSDSACVKYAIETLRKTLGYKKSTNLNPSSVTVSEIISSIGDWFPRHSIELFCDFDNEKPTQKNVSCLGNTLYKSEKAGIWLFSYIQKKTLLFKIKNIFSKQKRVGHMVIGFPSITDDMLLLMAAKVITQ